MTTSFAKLNIHCNTCAQAYQYIHISCALIHRPKTSSLSTIPCTVKRRRRLRCLKLKKNSPVFRATKEDKGYRAKIPRIRRNATV